MRRRPEALWPEAYGVNRSLVYRSYRADSSFQRSASGAVSYTHLDVYKRQVCTLQPEAAAFPPPPPLTPALWPDAPHARAVPPASAQYRSFPSDRIQFPRRNSCAPQFFRFMQEGGSTVKRERPASAGRSPVCPNHFCLLSSLKKFSAKGKIVEGKICVG